MAIIIAGYSDADKMPGFYGQTQFGAGPINILSIPLILLICGLKSSSAGSIQTNQDVVAITSNEDADTYLGAGGEAARMCYAAIAETRGYDLRATCPTAAAGVAASMTITIANNATTAGIVRLIIDGNVIDTTVNVGDTPTTIASNIVTSFGRFPRISCTAASALGVVTLTQKSLGVRGNRRILYNDAASVVPPGAVTVTLGGGGASPTSSTLVQGIYFAGGTGTETLTTTLANIFPARYHRIAIAQNDSVSLASWLTQNQSKAGVLEGRMEHYVVGSNDTLAATTSLAQTTLNDQRFQMVWLAESEIHPSELAAAMAAWRAATESSNPNPNYDGLVLKSVKPQRFPSQRPNRATQESCLENSVTPLLTGDNGQVTCVRAITTHSLNGTNPDYRTLDVADSYVPDFIRDDLRIFATTSFFVDNPYVQPDPAVGDPPLPSGVATPTLWNSAITKRLRDWQAKRVLTQVAQNPPASEYNSAAGRLMSAIPVIPLPKLHAVGALIKQFNAS